jgi:hypothetical protein
LKYACKNMRKVENSSNTICWPAPSTLGISEWDLKEIKISTAEEERFPPPQKYAFVKFYICKKNFISVIHFVKHRYTIKNKTLTTNPWLR